jgi:hypothetical protein
MKLESQTADGRFERDEFQTKESHIEGKNMVPHFEIIPLDSNNASECKSHPSPLTNEIQPITSMNEVIYPNQEFFVNESKKFNNQSFEMKMDKNTINTMNVDLKSLTQPLNNLHFGNHEEGFGNHATSLNSHPQKAENKYNSFLEGNNKQTKFVNIGSDEINYADNRKSVSDNMKGNFIEEINAQKESVYGKIFSNGMLSCDNLLEFYRSSTKMVQKLREGFEFSLIKLLQFCSFTEMIKLVVHKKANISF